MKNAIIIPIVAIGLFGGEKHVKGQNIERPYPQEWNSLVEGGSFIDLFKAMPEGKVRTDEWGADAVKYRYIDNGIEVDSISYWGGNILKGDDGKYHMFVCGWKENSPEGHMSYKTHSMAFRAIADNSIGPFTLQETLGLGHNTEVIKLDQGGYMVYSILGYNEDTDCAYYYSDNITGPWERFQLPYDLRDRMRKPLGKNWFHNMSFAKREDGSVLMVNRGGGLWVSKNGRSTYNQITDKSVYPIFDGKYEDPVMWRDNVQYHMIVNDWLGRIAYYLRSKDGVDWIVETGQAYTPSIAVHENNVKEEWYKYERLRIFQDEHGRAIQANFAVIDTLKHEDLSNDRHSSKNISIPLQKGMLLEMLEKQPFKHNQKEIAVRFIAEDGFSPKDEVDVSSLRFGASSEVNYGRGAMAVRSEKEGDDLIVYFSTINHGISQEEFAPKVIGKDKNGVMIFGFMRLPWVNYKPAMLSARQPKVKGSKLEVMVENFGQSPSENAFVSVNKYNDNDELEQLGSTVVSSIKPYAKAKVELKCLSKAKVGDEVIVEINQSNEAPVKFSTVLN